MTSAEWPAEPQGPEAQWRGVRGRPGDKGEKGEPGGITAVTRRAIIWLVILIFAVSAMAFALGARAISSVVSAERSQCLADHDIAGVAHVKVTQKPSPVLIAWVVHERAAWRGLGCPGNLPPPDPSFTMWAHRYGLLP